MKAARYRNENGELLTVSQVSSLSNLGVYTVRRIAKESGAIRKIGKCCRINRKIFFDFIENTYAD